MKELLSLKEVLLLKKYLLKIFISSKLLSTKTTGQILLIPILSTTMFTNLQLSVIILIIAYVLDFFTGILASWVAWKEIPKEKRKANLIQSKLMRKSIIKGIGYMIFVGLVFGMNLIIFKKTIHLDSISETKFTITELAIGFCIVIEGYSAVFENLKHAGFDLVAKFNQFVKWIASTKKKITDLYNS